jgi:hypothetical protein
VFVDKAGKAPAKQSDIRRHAGKFEQLFNEAGGGLEGKRDYSSKRCEVCAGTLVPRFLYRRMLLIWCPCAWLEGAPNACWIVNVASFGNDQPLEPLHRQTSRHKSSVDSGIDDGGPESLEKCELLRAALGARVICFALIWSRFALEYASAVSAASNQSTSTKKSETSYMAFRTL